MTALFVLKRSDRLLYTLIMMFFNS